MLIYERTKKKTHRQIARFIALKYFTTNVREVEKKKMHLNVSLIKAKRTFSTCVCI